MSNKPKSWTDRIKKTRQPGNKHTVIKGTSGTGKSTCYLEDLILEVGLMFILLIDPFGETADDFLKKLYGRYDKVLVDDLSWKDRVLPVCFLPVSDDPEEFERERQNKLHRDNVIESLLRMQDTDLLPQPVKEDTLDAGLLLYQKLPKAIRMQVPLHVICDLYRPWTEWHQFLTDACPDHELAMRFIRMRSLHESTRLSSYGAAERVLMKTFAEPAVKRRDTHPGVNVPHLIREKYVIIIKGGPGVSMYPFRAIAEYWFASVIHYLEQGDE